MITIMKEQPWILCLLFVLAAVQQSYGRRGYIFVAPKQVIPESNTTMCLLFNYIPNTSANINITIRDEKNVTEASKQFTLTQTDRSIWTCFNDFYVPKIESYRGYLQLQMELPGLQGDYRVDETKQINTAFLPRQRTTFIETDKDKYRFSETVKFRILTMDIDTKPLTETIPEVWIEDPGLNRVAQWKNVSMARGLTQLSYSLSKEPPLGHWSIIVKTVDGEERLTFEVAEYVLPKFTLEVTPQRKYGTIYSTDTSYTWNICAKYTHGQSVPGTIDVTFKKRRYHWRPFAETPSTDVSEVIYQGKQVFGCENLTLTNETMKLERSGNIELLVVFKEEGTGISLNTTFNGYISTRYLTIEEDRRQEYFKPGLFYKGEFRLKSSDDEGLEGEELEMCTEYFTEVSKTCQNVTTGVDGKIYYQVLPLVKHEHNDSGRALKITIQKYGNDSFTRYFTFSRWYSDSYNFIRIEAPQKGKLKCGQTYQMELTYTPPEYAVTASVAVMSSGRIVKTQPIVLTPNDPELTFVSDPNVIDLLVDEGQATPKVLHKTFPLKIDAALSGRVNLLIHYTLKTGEIIAAGKAFDTETCLQHQVTLRWNKDRPAPAEDIQLSVEAKPQSYCGLSAVDRSVRLLSNNNQLDKDHIQNTRSWRHLYKYSSPRQQQDYMYCKGKEVLNPEILFREKRTVIRHPFFFGSTADSITAFDIGGLIVFTDLLLETRPCFQEQNRVFLAQARPGAPGAPAPAPEAASIGGGGAGFAGTSMNKERTPPRVRDFFPETWLFELEYMGESNSLTKNLKVPDTITEWVASGFCLSPSDGIGIADEATFISFTPFFIDYNLPYSVKRGETFVLRVSVFNYLDQEAPVTLELQQSSEYEAADGVYTTTLVIPANRNKVATFEVTATALGNINITTFAYVEPQNGTSLNITFNSDAIKRALLVEAEGFPQESTQVEFICVENNTEVRKSLDCSAPTGIIPDSARTVYSVTGDIMGPMLSNLDSFIQFPTGCGEQNMARLVPNIHALTYLDSVNAAEPELREKSIKHMEEGYQRQLKYKHKDGSYSAFGSRDETGSIWLTAFVLKSFSQAKPYTFIEDKILNEAKKFILRHQLKDGCFERIGRTYSSSLKGGAAQGNDTRTLTAYIITSLLEAGEDPTSDHMKRALQCIQQVPDKPYSQALAAYASFLAYEKTDKSNKRTVIHLKYRKVGQDLLNKLLQKAKRQAQLMWWEQEAGCRYCRDSNVEIAGYALMAFLISSPTGWDTNRPIARYLISQRNINGAFYSTQDTVVALEALTKYAMAADEVPLKEVGVECRGCNPIQITFINPENRLIANRFDVGAQFVSDVIASGHGCVVAQCSIKYNIPNPKPRVAFEMSVASYPIDEPPRCRSSELQVCVKYVLDDGESNMAVVEVNMASGYTYRLASLDALQNDVDLELKRYETEDNKVNFYFDSLSKTLKCFAFQIDQENVVKNPKPSNVKVYDYYQTELTTSQAYTVCGDTPPVPPPSSVDAALTGSTEQTTDQATSTTETTVTV